MNTEGTKPSGAIFYEELDRAERQIETDQPRSKPHRQEVREEIDTWFRGRSKKELSHRKRKPVDQ